MAHLSVKKKNLILGAEHILSLMSYEKTDFVNVCTYGFNVLISRNTTHKYISCTIPSHSFVITIINLYLPLYYLSFTHVSFRAMETASLLEIPDAQWYTEVVLRERDKGVLDNLPWTEKNEKHKYDLELRQRDSFFWAPPVSFPPPFLILPSLLSPFSSLCRLLIGLPGWRKHCKRVCASGSHVQHIAT